MSNRMSQTEIQPQRPQRADARANHDKLVAAARALFTEKGTSAPLEEVAARAGVGIGTLYRHFPTRHALLEAVYVDEVEAMARAMTELEELPPWDALSQWLHQYVGFAATKRALNEALMETDPNSDVLLDVPHGDHRRRHRARRTRTTGGRRPQRHDLPGHRADGRRNRDGADRRPRTKEPPARARARRAPLPPTRLLAQGANLGRGQRRRGRNRWTRIRRST